MSETERNETSNEADDDPIQRQCLNRGRQCVVCLSVSSIVFLSPPLNGVCTLLYDSLREE